MTRKLFDDTAYELTEDGRRTMYDVAPKGSIVAGDEVKQYGWESIAKKADKEATVTVSKTDK